jgi:hypothetical protein
MDPAPSERIFTVLITTGIPEEKVYSGRSSAVRCDFFAGVCVCVCVFSCFSSVYRLRTGDRVDI